ncbi:TVG0222877 [Thermoplasma volcanium GSS1]|uniref:TVG0222877 protein n=1 Tax=Thermoplasma volcanium (strain ATCC 51530 / DSM 4299 / JCM 9571 / NBRC 15438 / GSS1) TaxID=273116 RepID=Q97C87_THEVO|nr:MFS transporter [Thermoplasma volcanium]BAB59358.1 TVG0222877 [Thermoplasma volcanium GSS1]
MVFASSIKDVIIRLFLGSGTTEERVMDLSIGDGVLWAIYSSLTQQYVIPLAIFLFGTVAPVGFITGIPLLAVPFSQLSAYWILKKIDNLKVVTIITTFLDRLPWLLIAILILFRPAYFLYIFIALLIIRAFFASLSGTTWTLWVPGLISEEKRDRYFSVRNMAMRASGLIGYFIAMLVFIFIKFHGFDYFTIFTVSFLFSSASIAIMKKIPEAKTNDVKITSKKTYTSQKFFILLFTVSIFALGYNFSQPYILLFILGKDYLNSSSIIYTFLLIAGSLVFIASQKLGYNLISRYGYGKSLLISSIILSMTVFAWIFVRNIIEAMILFSLSSIPVSVYSLSGFNFVVSGSGGEGRVKRTSLYTLFNSISTAVGPIIANLVYVKVENILDIFLISSAILMVAAVSSWLNNK